MRASRRLAPFAVCVAGWLASAADVPAFEASGWISEGPSRTPYYTRDSGQVGPTVLVVSGLHGDEPAGPCAADQLRHWVPSRGKLIVVPRASQPAIEAGTRLTPASPARFNLNRRFPPDASSNAPALAGDLWAFVRGTRPDWLVDLHEGSDFRVATTNSVGSSVIASRSPEAVAAARAIVEALNAEVTLTNRRFMVLRQPIKGSLARAAADGLGIRSMIVETTTRSQPLALRARQHRMAVAALLGHLEMSPPGARARMLSGAAREGGGLSVALYDGAGNGGKGVAKVLQQAGERPGMSVVRVCPEDIRAGALESFHVVVFTGGSGSGQARGLGEAGKAAVRRFIRQGGGYVGICAGAYLACSGFEWSLGIIDARTLSSRWQRGTGTVVVEPVGAGRELFSAPSSRLNCRYAQGPIVGPAGREDLADYECWAWFRSELAENGTPRGIMVDSPAVFAGRFGDGRVLCFSPHPEQTSGLEEVVPRALAWAAGRQ